MDRTKAAEANEFHDFIDSNMDNTISLAAAAAVEEREEPGVTQNLPVQERDCALSNPTTHPGTFSCMWNTF